ncbi:MAG: YVTN family beta-propeller domain-containing protein [Acidobacteria bacterium]|nr:MAG: YVTN family beta-propeller domain-containing protein [Acidobacteriota bacterium]
MTARRFLSWTYIVASVLVLSSPAAFRAAPAGSEYHVIRNILLGGDGGWDYVTVDPDAKRVYAPRGTHIQVVDEVSGKLVADMSDLKGLHGVAVAPEFNRGFVTGNDPDPLIYLFDLKSLKITGKITPPSAMDSDSLMYDTVSKRAFINTAASNNAQAVDAASGKLVGTVMLPGRPEAAVPDGKGSMFVNIVDKSQMVEYDTRALVIKNTWSSEPCFRGVGLSMDREHRRLFIGCQGSVSPQRDDPSTVSKNLLVVMNADNGKVVASMPIGIGTDGTAYDPSTGDVFVTCRDSGDGKNGVTKVFHEDSPDKYSLVADVETIYGARTIALDPKTHHVFSIGTEKNEPVPATADNPYPRPRPVPSTFTVVEIGK